MRWMDGRKLMYLRKKALTVNRNGWRERHGTHGGEEEGNRRARERNSDEP